MCETSLPHYIQTAVTYRHSQTPSNGSPVSSAASAHVNTCSVAVDVAAAAAAAHKVPAAAAPAAAAYVNSVQPA